MSTIEEAERLAPTATDALRMDVGLSERRIFKYPLVVTDWQMVALPRGAEILTVQIQRGQPQLWALVDPTAPIERRDVGICGTGHIVPNGVPPYLATFQLHGGELVFHVFAERAAPTTEAPQ